MLNKDICWRCYLVHVLNGFQSNDPKYERVFKSIHGFFNSNWKNTEIMCPAVKNGETKPGLQWIKITDEPPIECYYRVEQLMKAEENAE